MPHTPPDAQDPAPFDLAAADLPDWVEDRAFPIRRSSRPHRRSWPIAGIDGG